MSLLSPPPVRIAMSTYALCHISIYFLCKTKMTDGRFVDFCHALLSCSLLAQIDPLRTLYSRHSRDLGSLVAIQQCTHEIVNNRFDLLLIYVDRQPEHVGPYQPLTTQPHPNQSIHVQTHFPSERYLLARSSSPPLKYYISVSQKKSPHQQEVSCDQMWKLQQFLQRTQLPSHRPQTHRCSE